MQISEIRTALAAAARTVTMPSGIGKLTATGYATDAVTTPHFFVGDYSVTFDRAMKRALDEVEFTCAVMVSRSDDLSGQRILDGLLSGSGPGSLKTAIEAARGAPGEYALGGLAHDLHVTRMQSYRWYEIAGIHYLGAELIVKVIGEG